MKNFFLFYSIISVFAFITLFNAYYDYKQDYYHLENLHNCTLAEYQPQFYYGVNMTHCK